MRKQYDVCTECGYEGSNMCVWYGRFVCTQCFTELENLAKMNMPESVEVEPMPKPFNDGRHDVSDKMINNLQELAYSQDDFGMDKYKKPLKAHYNYDWLKMAKEELVDLCKYLECETERKNVIIQFLEMAIEDKNWDYVKVALHELKKDGTAK